ncbi:MAG: hypothetical protein K6A44_06205 [bacterium]|nr:hypothetical protein [bacterium]
MTTIFGIRLSDRINNSTDLQNLLTEFGCIIKTRIGLHDTSCGVCSPYGIILLEVVKNEEKVNEFLCELQNLKGVKFNIMEL